MVILNRRNCSGQLMVILNWRNCSEKLMAILNFSGQLHGRRSVGDEGTRPPPTFQGGGTA